MVTEGLFDYLHKQVDSVIFEDAEIRRTRIPLPIASKYFNLSGLDTISVYHEADYAGDALFVRVEYMEDLIEGKFIAVFIPARKIIFPDEPDYCISKVKHQYETTPVTYQEIKDEQLTRKLIDTFVLDSAKVWKALHTRVAPYESVYSAISMHSRLLLIETTGDQSRILMDLKEDWSISEITPLHLQSNGKPMLLFTMGVNETDMMWSAVAAFSGDAYVFGAGNRF